MIKQPNAVPPPDTGNPPSDDLDQVCSEDVMARFAAYGWQVEQVDNGNEVSALSEALQRARADETRPSLICVRTHIGFGSPHKQDTYEAHGAPWARKKYDSPSSISVGRRPRRSTYLMKSWHAFGRRWSRARPRKRPGNNCWQHTARPIQPWPMSTSACWPVTCQAAGKLPFPSLHLMMGRWRRAKPVAKY